MKRLFALVFLLAACGDKSTTSAPPTASTSAPEAAAPSASVTATASASAAPSASAAAGVAAAHYEGTYTAKRLVIGDLPKDVKVPAWDKDPGTAAAGPGTLSLDVDARGQVKGTAKGSLGELVLSGELDDGMIRLVLRPVSPNEATSMSGVMTIKVDAGTGTIRASSRDGNLVREGDVKLTKK